MRTYIFHVSGTHCASCKILIEDVLGEQDFVKNIRVNLKKEIVEIEIDSDQHPDELARILTDKIRSNGYILSTEKVIQEKKRDDAIWKAIPIGLAFLVIFFMFQKSGILNLGIGGLSAITFCEGISGQCQ